MPVVFHVHELQLIRNIPEGDLVELAAELDMTVPETIEVHGLVSECLVRIAQRARSEGLPLSRYDRDDLEALPPAHLGALAELCGVAPDVDAMLKAGAKTYKVYHRTRPSSQVPLLLPMFLSALARHVAEENQR